MQISIDNLWVVIYKNNLTNQINAHSKLFDDLEKAQSFANEVSGIVQPVFYNNKK